MKKNITPANVAKAPFKTGIFELCFAPKYPLIVGEKKGGQPAINKKKNQKTLTHPNNT